MKERKKENHVESGDGERGNKYWNHGCRIGDDDILPLVFNEGNIVKEDDLVDVSGTTIIDKGFHGRLFFCKIKDISGRRWTKNKAFSLNLWYRW